MVIDGVWGLGEALVSGQATPDHWVVNARTGAVLEARVARHLRHILRAGGIITILGGNRRQCDPIAQPLEGFIMTLSDLTADVCEVLAGST